MYLSENLNIMIFTIAQIELASRGYIRSKFVNSFHKDLIRINIIKRQLTRYSKTKKINLRLLLNNLILFFNCFNTSIGKILIKEIIIDTEFQSIIKTCLIEIDLMTNDEWINIRINEEFYINIKSLLS